MHSIELKYGNRLVHFEYDNDRFDVVAVKSPESPLNDNQLGVALDAPIGTPALEDLIEPGQSVLIAVPDATREIGAGQVVNLLVRRLIANGTMPYEIAVIFSTGLHRPVTPAEKERILTPFIAQRTKALNHDPRDLMSVVRIAETSDGLPIEINRSAVDADHVILVGGITFHYFAGFTGGRKLICPGLASKRTIVGTHALAFDHAAGTRAKGVGPGLLDGNPVHEALIEAVAPIAPSFAINTHSDAAGQITKIFCGDWNLSHRNACDSYSTDNQVVLKSKRDLVIVSCGGSPYDINLIQAHKAIDMASACCREGGTIIVLAECPDGVGSKEFEKWIRLGNSTKIARRLSESYSIGGQTAWSLLSKAERFDIRIVSELPEELIHQAGLQKEPGLSSALAKTEPTSSGFLMPFGAKFQPVLN